MTTKIDADITQWWSVRLIREMLIVRVCLSVQNKCPASSMDRMNGYGPFDERSNRSWGTIENSEILL